ncbi:MAG: DNA polymerase thumb domain-containing protein, partial [Flammeovirgaceae bacterium]
SAGISYNKFLAKVASDIDKPNGLFTIPPAQAEAFLEGLPIEKFFGIGKVTAKKMKAMGIHTGADLKKQSEFELARSFGKAGRHYYKIVRGNDDREVKPDRIRKSISVEETFREDITLEQELANELESLVQSLQRRMQKIKVMGKTITLKIKYADFTLQTRSKSLAFHTDAASTIGETSIELLKSPHLPNKPVRLLGVGVSNLKFPVENQVAYQLTINF